MLRGVGEWGAFGMGRNIYRPYRTTIQWRWRAADSSGMRKKAVGGPGPNSVIALNLIPSISLHILGWQSSTRLSW